MRDEYEKQIYKLAQAGKLGWSSGALGHLVEREPAGKAFHIKTWFIGEASLTPTPAEPRNNAMPVKSLSTPEMAADASGDNFKENIMNDEIKAAVDAALAEREAKAAAEAQKNGGDYFVAAAAQDAYKASIALTTRALAMYPFVSEVLLLACAPILPIPVVPMFWVTPVALEARRTPPT